MFETRIFDTISGAHLLTVEPSDASWAAKLDGSGQGSITVPLRGQGIPRATARDLFRANARCVAHVDESGTVIAAGLLLRPDYSRDDGSVTIGWVDIRHLIDQRLGFGVGSYGPGGDLTVTSKSRSGAARALLSRALHDGTEPQWELPIDLPSDSSGSFTRTWRHYEFATMNDGLEEIEAEGVEVYFDPYLSSGSLRWATRVAAPIALGGFDLPVTSEASSVVGLHVKSDGSKQLTGVIYSGNGAGSKKITAWAGHGPYTIPIRDAHRTADTVKTVAQLQRIADADLAEHFYPVEQWSFGVRLDETVKAAAVKPGRLLRMDVRGDEWIPDGMYTQRVVGVSGDLTQTVTPEVQAYGG